MSKPSNKGQSTKSTTNTAKGGAAKPAAPELDLQAAKPANEAAASQPAQQAAPQGQAPASKPEAKPKAAKRTWAQKAEKRLDRIHKALDRMYQLFSHEEQEAAAKEVAESKPGVPLSKRARFLDALGRAVDQAALAADALTADPSVAPAKVAATPGTSRTAFEAGAKVEVTAKHRALYADALEGQVEGLVAIKVTGDGKRVVLQTDDGLRATIPVAHVRPAGYAAKREAKRAEREAKRAQRAAK